MSSAESIPVGEATETDVIAVKEAQGDVTLPITLVASPADDLAPVGPDIPSTEDIEPIAHEIPQSADDATPIVHDTPTADTTPVAVEIPLANETALIDEHERVCRDHATTSEDETSPAVTAETVIAHKENDHLDK